jgi:hypothetical protein
VAEQGRFEGEFGGFFVAEFANENHIGIAAQQIAKTLGKGAITARLYRILFDARQQVFNRIFNGHDVTALFFIDDVDDGSQGG